MKKFLLMASALLMVAVMQAATVTISASEWATAQGLDNGDAVTSYTKDGVTIVLAQGSGESAPSWNSTQSTMAAVAGNTMTITVSEDYRLSTASFTVGGANAQATRLAGNEWSSGEAAVNSGNSKQVDWTGSATSLSVTFTGAETFASFAFTLQSVNQTFTVTFVDIDGKVLKTESVAAGKGATAPTPPTVVGMFFVGWSADFSNVTEDMTVQALYDYDKSVLNDTVIMTAEEIREYNELEYFESFELADYTEKGKTVQISSGANNNTLQFTSNWSDKLLALRQNNTLTFTADCKIHKIILNFTELKCSVEGNDQHYCAESPASSDKGKVVKQENSLVWTGSTTAVTFTFDKIEGSSLWAYYNCELMDITIICDKNDNQEESFVVVFLDENGQEIVRETVLEGKSLTNIPAGPDSEDDCMEFVGWDVTDFSHITTDLTVHPVYSPKQIFSLTATEWAETGKITFTKDGYTLYATRAPLYNDEESSLIFTGGCRIIILNPNYFYKLKIRCPNEHSASSLAGFEWSSGSAVQDGVDVIWTGETDSLAIYGSAFRIVSIASLCRHIDYFTVEFLDANDKPLSTQTVLPGESAVAPADPKHENYCLAFAGWDKAFTNVRCNMTIRPTWNTIEDCHYIPAGHVEVTFLDAKGDTIESQFVPIGGTATAPTPPAVTYYTFTGWSAPLTNITESQTIQAQYAFDKNSPDIMTVPQWVSWTEEHRWDYGTQVIVKGIVHDVVTKLEEGGKLTFRFSEDGENDWENNQPVAYGAHILGVNGQSFANHLQLEQGDTVYVFGTYAREDIDFGYYYYYSQEVVANGHLAYLGKAKESEDRILFYGQAPDAALLYDFSGNGLKQIVSFSTESMGEEVEDYRFTIWASGDASQLFSEREKLGSGMANTGFDERVLYFEDVNQDGKTDVTTLGSVFMSQADGYTKIDEAIAVTNMDLNRDGRPDYMLLDKIADFTTGYSYYGTIMYQLSDGSFQKEQMQAMTWSEFVAQMTPEERDQYNNPQDYSLGDVSRYTYTLQLGGACLAYAPRRAPGIGTKVHVPTKAIDMNGDGLMDLIDEATGIIYTNMDNGKWVWTQTNGTVGPVDLNGDGVTDFIFPGARLYTAIYDKEKNTFVSTVLYQNATVDDRLYCYDFDHDGDVDILATFSAATNATGYAYTCFFLNDGQGHFTQQPEQSYGNLLFSACQDIDGDGYMDILAFRSEVTVASESSSEVEVVWLQGNKNNSLAAPQRLYSFYIYNNSSEPQPMYEFLSNARIHVEDLDNDGKMDIWVSDVSVSFTELYTMKTAVSNTRPTAPSAPTLEYKDGLLTVTWGNGSDNETVVSDLTYALRIGTTAGGNDILAAHANKDGSRRNFLDGNMGKLHSYTIDLRSYSPSTIYVAVQAIDAQHSGSAWSAESTVKHNNLSADFSLSSDKIAFGESVKVYYTSLPEGYKHQWEYADGKLLRDGSYLHLTFPTPGEKTIKHTVIAPDAQTVSASKTLVVLPAGLGTVVVENIYDESNRSVFSALAQPLADFNYDGRLDGIMLGDYDAGNNYSLTVQTGNKDKIFQKAAGLWNTNILSDGERFNYTDEIRWLDWNRDGHVDLLMTIEFKQKFAQLLHAPNGAALTAREDNNTLKMLFGTWWKENKELYEYYTLNDEDFLHSGRPTIFYQHPMYEHYVINFAEDGSLEEQKLKATTQQELFGQILENHAAVFTADFDHDGWTDFASLYSNTDTWSGLTVFFNRGNGRFEYALIPFVSPLQLNTDKCHLADFNGDGFQDLIVSLNTENAESYILWNNANNTFSAPETLPNSQNITDAIRLTDIDNNGHLDLMARTLNPAEGEGGQGVYVWYMGEEGLLSHGFLQPKLVDIYAKDFYLAPDEHVLLAGSTLYSLAAQSDERPAAPANVRASLTDEGLLIEWDAAKDDHTPAALMRYNLAVKEQGAATYLISPQNGMNANAAYMPDYAYIHATQFLIPTSYLSNANYEISLQALDLQNRLSLFSEQLVTTVIRNPIEVPESACANDDVTVSYRGAETTGTPVWNWDGGQATGSGFGPYTVVWTTSGEKTITLTLGGQTYTATTTIDDPKELEVTLPTVLYEGITASASVPDGIEYQWYVSIDGSELYPVDHYGILLPSTSVFVSYDYRLIAQGLNITAYYRSDYTDKSLVGHQVELYLHVTNANGCETYFYSDVTVLANTAIPTLTLVTTDANGHNVLSWTNAEAFATVNVYKEGNALNDFQLIGSANAESASFTDAYSDATQKAERYYLTGVMANGEESPESAIHKTVHMTINRGVMNGTFNLIWNEYAGASVSAYRILRGEAPANLAQIAVVAASNTSFTDQTPVDAQPYYAIEYVLSSGAAAPAKDVNRAPQAELSGRSNVVNRKDLDEGIESILHAEGSIQKILYDGQIYILVGDKIYDATGKWVR
ncbi:MAG: VCBS repeat-containing protein [Paludibacteraceae bacterium]|nr:VCBS repeat-containing protein [Paludibacteraceae bacterium]MBQ6790857.1 VCBS repeat-containing protein [Paludibacteraceae bacterium]